jgi:hypothetical protein
MSGVNSLSRSAGLFSSVARAYLQDRGTVQAIARQCAAWTKRLPLVSK